MTDGQLAKFAENSVDVVVVGTGNAGFAAALAARQAGATVLMVDRAGEDWIGGNSYCTAGAFRFAHGGLDDLTDLIEQPSTPNVDLDPYPAEAFEADMRRLTEGRCDSELTDILVNESRETIDWLRTQGVRWQLLYERQAMQVDGRSRFWGGLSVGVIGGGKGLIAAYHAAARASSIEIALDSPVTGVKLAQDGSIELTVGGRPDSFLLRSRAVVLACGGFEANPQLRASHLGPGWDVAKVRGTPHNTGEALMAAIAAGAQPYGHWSGAHAIPWDAAAPPFGNRELTNRFSRLSYPLGVMVNQHGRRFVDEGADFRNYTYAKYGAEVLQQPAARAFQIFDANTISFVSAVDYDTAIDSRSYGSTLQALADQAGINATGLRDEIAKYNASIGAAPFDPARRDGKRTKGIDPPKSNWAQPVAEAPFTAFAVTCGITFTFGGLRIARDAGVLDGLNRTMPGVFAAGETVGGLFYHNYPGGSGLMSGAVFGRRAGEAAARFAAVG